MNGIDKQKFPLVVSRIIAKFHEKSGRVFTEKEEDQLKQLLGISSEQLDTFISGCSYIFDQAAYHNLTAEKLMGNLQSSTMDDTQAQLLAGIWGKERMKFINNLRDNTLGAPQVLDSVDWRLQLTMAQDGISQTKGLNAVLSLTLLDVDDTDKKNSDTVTMELSKEDLKKLYEDLERVQHQLDQISK